MSDATPTRNVHNGSGAGVFVPGYGLLDARAQAEVPDIPEVRELLGNGTLWTQDPPTTPDTTIIEET